MGGIGHCSSRVRWDMGRGSGAEHNSHWQPPRWALEQTEWRAWGLISRVRNQQADSKGEQGHR